MEPEQTTTQNIITGSECVECKTITYPPRLICPKCRGTSFTTVNIPNEGKIYSYTIINIPMVHYNNPPYIHELIYFEQNSYLKVTARLEISNGKEPIIDQKVQLSMKFFSESRMIPVLVAKVL